MKYELTTKEARAMATCSNIVAELIGKEPSADPRVKVTINTNGGMLIEAEENYVCEYINLFNRFLPILGSQLKALLGTAELASEEYSRITATPKEKVTINT